MTKYQTARTFMVLFIGLMICNQTIRSLTYVNLMYIFFFSALLLFFGVKLRVLSSWNHVKLLDLGVAIFGGFIVSYAFISTILNQKFEWGKLFELSVLFLFYFLGREIKKEDIFTLSNIILFFGFLHSIFLLYDRGYVYSSGVNYLLMSIAVGLSCCISYLRVFYSSNKLKKIFFIFIALVTWLGLFSMQSRAVFLFAFGYYLLLPAFILKGKAKTKFIIFISMSTFMVISYFYQDIVYFYENSKIYQRMSDLFFNYQNEPRIVTYTTFFSHLSEFWFSGYGLNQTSSNIYVYTIEKYPHNFVLEFWSEFGLLGLSFALFFSFMPFFYIFKKRKVSEEEYISILIYLYYLMNFMKSFSIYDSSMLFLSAGIVVSLFKYSNVSSFGHRFR
ncbi:O-antigen ligase family protein [Vibrio alginolyticus]|uniref:O-antigen ligase family protein n=1 Tax=Vibrio alginolyticus TaxID=663 RepID=UPI003A95709C